MEELHLQGPGHLMEITVILHDNVELQLVNEAERVFHSVQRLCYKIKGNSLYPEPTASFPMETIKCVPIKLETLFHNFTQQKFIK